MNMKVIFQLWRIENVDTEEFNSGLLLVFTHVCLSKRLSKAKIHRNLNCCACK